MGPKGKTVLWVVAVLALGAGASSAQAAEVGRCVKLQKLENRYEGNYLDKNCLEAATEAEKATGKKNKYEWEEITATPPFNPAFTSRDGMWRLAGAGGFPVIICRSSTDHGTWHGFGADVEYFVLENCTIQLSPKGPVKRLANIELGPILTGILPPPPPPHNQQAWDRYYMEEGAPVMSVEYEPGKLVRLMGEFTGMVTPVNKMTPKFTTTFGEGEGEQALTLETSENGGATWESSSATLSDAAKNTQEGKQKIEIRTT